MHQSTPQCAPAENFPKGDRTQWVRNVALGAELPPGNKIGFFPCTLGLLMLAFLNFEQKCTHLIKTSDSSTASHGCCEWIDLHYINHVTRGEVYCWYYEFMNTVFWQLQYILSSKRCKKQWVACCRTHAHCISYLAYRSFNPVWWSQQHDPPSSFLWPPVVLLQ